MSTPGPEGPGRPEPVGASRGATPRITARLAVACVLAVLIVAGLFWSTVNTRIGQLLGELILGGRPVDTGLETAAEAALASISRLTLVAGTLAVVVIGLLQRRPWLGVCAVGVIAAANVSAQVLKSVILVRSDLLDGQFYPLPNSYPSGHATAAASVAVAILLVLPPLVRAPTVFISGLVVGAIAASTLVTGWHRMADALGGIFLAAAWGAGLAAILSWRRGFELVGRRTELLGRVGSAVPLLIGLGILVVGSLGYLLVAADPLGVLGYLAGQGGSRALFWAALAVTMGTSLLVFGGFGLAIRDITLDQGPLPDPPSGTTVVGQ